MGMIFRGLTFGGVNSLDYGIFITGEAVYNAPERSVTSIEIEGRNGDLLIDNGRFLNIEVSYPAGCFAETQQEFKQKIELFRNAIVSQISYQRLTDDYNPDEYRLAVYKSGLDVNVAVLHQGGEFTLTFDCKPQRFLTSGETKKKIPEWSDLHTDSGSLVTIDNSSGEYAVKSLSTDIVPQQDLNGYDHPWAGGAGKNKVDGDGFVGYAFTKNSTNNYTFTKNGSAAADRQAGRASITLTENETYYFSFKTSAEASSGNSVSVRLYVNGAYASGMTMTYSNGYYYRSFTAPAGVEGINIYYQNNTTGIGDTMTVSDIQLEAGSSRTTYEPYENICPITGFDSANIYVSPTTRVGDATTYNVSFGSAGTVYGGTLDVVSGQLTVTHKLVEGTTSNITRNNATQYYTKPNDIKVTGSSYGKAEGLRSNQFFPYESGMSSSTVGMVFVNSGGAIRFNTANSYNSVSDLVSDLGTIQFVYPLATPLTYQLTATQVALLLGTNNVWSNTGDIQIEYGKGGNTLYNPTLFDSRPLIELTGAGTLGINNYIITITGSGKLYIDCDTMEAYTITGGIVTSANNRVSLNTTDYPVLRSGINNFTVGTGIRNVKITPRWWRI